MIGEVRGHTRILTIAVQFPISIWSLSIKSHCRYPRFWHMLNLFDGSRSISQKGAENINRRSGAVKCGVSLPGGGIRPPGFTRPPCTMEPWPSRLWNIAAAFYGFSILLVHKPKASGFQLRPFNGVRSCVRKLPRLPLSQKFVSRFGSFESLTSLFWFLFRR